MSKSEWVPRIYDKVMAEVNDKMVACYIQEINVEKRRNDIEFEDVKDFPWRCYDNVRVYVVRPMMEEFGKVNYSYKIDKVYQI